MNTNDVTRVEVIDQDGRSYVNWDEGNDVDLSLQDQGRTLKVFVSRRSEPPSQRPPLLGEEEELDPDAIIADYFARTKRPSLYDVMRDELGFSSDMCDEIVDAVADWLPKEHYTNSYEWDKCVRTIREGLR
jgi:hypothetical protein